MGAPASLDPPPTAEVDALPVLGRGELDYGGPSGYVGRGRSLRMRLPFGLWLPERGTVVLFALVLAGWVGYSRWEREVPLEPGDRSLVLTAGAVAAATGAFQVVPSAERIVRVETLLGGERIESTYAGAGAGAPELRWVTQRARSVDAARDTYRWSTVDLLTDWKLAGDGEVGLVELHEGLSWGDELRAFLVEVDGRPVGNAFAARLGRTFLYLELRGVWVEDRWTFQHMLEPVLDAAAARESR